MSQSNGVYETLPTQEARFSTIAPVIILSKEALFNEALPRGTLLATGDDGGETYEEHTPIASFNGASTYASGAIVTHNGGIYRANAAITSPGAWDASKWALTGLYKIDGVLLTDVEAGQKGVVLVIGKINPDYIEGFSAEIAQTLYPNILAS